LLSLRTPPVSTLFPYTTLFRSAMKQLQQKPGWCTPVVPGKSDACANLNEISPFGGFSVKTGAQVTTFAPCSKSLALIECQHLRGWPCQAIQAALPPRIYGVCSGHITQPQIVLGTH